MKNNKAAGAAMTAVFLLFAAALCITGTRLGGGTEYKKAAKTAWQPKFVLSFGENRRAY